MAQPQGEEFVNYSGGQGSLIYGATQPQRIQPTQFGGWIEADGVATQEDAAALASERFQTDYNISQQGEGGNRCMQALTYRGDCQENQGQRGVLYSVIQERNFVLGDVGRYSEQNPSANVPPEQQLIFDFVSPKDETLRLLQRFIMTALKARQARNPDAFAADLESTRDTRLPIFKTAIAQAQTMMMVPPPTQPSDYTFNFHKGVADTRPAQFRGVPVGPTGVAVTAEFPQAGGAAAAPAPEYVPQPTGNDYGFDVAAGSRAALASGRRSAVNASAPVQRARFVPGVRDETAESEQWDAAQSSDAPFVAQNWRVPGAHSYDGDLRASLRDSALLDLSPAATTALSVFATAGNQPIDVAAVFDLIASGRAAEIRTPVLLQMTQYIEDITGARRRDAELAGPLARDQLLLVMDRLRLALEKRDAFFGMSVRARKQPVRAAVAPLTSMLDAYMQRA
jgi:hypothetical protein